MEQIYASMLKSLHDGDFDNEYLRKNLIAFCSDGASVMLDRNSGVGTRLKNDYPNNFVFVFVLFYLPYLSSFHEKANCIAILWTGSPHSLGSCLFRGLWATCLPHRGVPLSALPKDTTSELAGLFSTTFPKCRAPSREAADAIFKVFWYDSTRGMNP